MTLPKTVESAADCTVLLNLPPDHVLNRECSFFYNVNATEETHRVRLADVLLVLYGEHYREHSSTLNLPIAVHQTWIGLYLNSLKIRDKIADHKKKQGAEYTAEHEKRTISDMKKRNCGAVMPFGTITPKTARKVDNIDSVTGIFPVDFDIIPSGQFDEIRERLKQDKHIVFLFQSITRGRLKGAVLLPQKFTNPSTYFAEIYNYFLDNYNLQIDSSCKDAVRLMFGSYDCDPFVNLEPVPFPLSADADLFRDVETAKPIKKSDGGIKYGSPESFTFPTPDGLRSAERIAEAVESQKISIVNNYDDWLRVAFGISNACGEHGSDLFHRICRLSEKYDAADSDAKYSEAMKTNKGAVTIGTVRHLAELHGVKFGKASYVATIEQKTVKTTEHPPATFWRVLIDERPEKPAKLVIDYADFYDFLRSHGFARVTVRGVTSQPLLCRISNGIADEQTPQQIREYIAMWIYNNVPQKFTGGITRNDLIEETANRTRGGKDAKDSSLLSENHLFTNLIVQHHDAVICDYDTVRIPYENGVLEITANSMTMKPYSSERVVLKRNVLPRAFKLPTAEDITTANSDAAPFGAFVRALSGYYSQMTDNHDEQCAKRWRAIRNALAYAVHNYVTTENRKMVIFVDDFDYLDYGKANGGTGKTLLLLAIKHMRDSFLVDCKNADFSRPTAWQSLKPSTRAVLLDDAVQEFDLRDLYSMITTGPTVEMKYRDPWQFETGAHPRVVMASNYGVRTDSQHSSERRVWHVEVSKYFGKDREPCDDKRIGMLYDTWTAEQWYMFDVFFASACQDYLKQDRKTACAPINTGKAQKSKLARNTHPLFVDELEKIMTEKGPDKEYRTDDGRHRRDYRFDVSDTCDRLSDACGFQIKPRTFNSWLKLYADYCDKTGGYTFTEVKPSERTRTDYGQQIRTTLLILETGPRK